MVRPCVCGAVYSVLGWIGGNRSPAGPGLCAKEIADCYRSHHLTVRIGFVGSVIFIYLNMPWSAVLSARIAKIVGHGLALTYLQVIGGTLTVIVVTMSAEFWIAAEIVGLHDKSEKPLLPH